MKNLESRLNKIEEMLSPTPSVPITHSIVIRSVGVKPGQTLQESFDVVTRREHGRIVTRKIEYPPVMAPENPEEFKQFMKQRREQALKECNPHGA